jgi:hypothetical protein
LRAIALDRQIAFDMQPAVRIGQMSDLARSAGVLERGGDHDLAAQLPDFAGVLGKCRPREFDRIVVAVGIEIVPMTDMPAFIEAEESVT